MSMRPRTIIIIATFAILFVGVAIAIGLSAHRQPASPIFVSVSRTPPAIPSDLPLSSTPGIPSFSSEPTPTATASAIPTERPPTQPLPTDANEVSPTPQPPDVLIEEAQPAAGSTNPFDLPVGVYRVFFMSDAAAAVTPVVLEGECSTYALIESDGPFEGSATYRSTGCRVQFEVVSEADWRLSVETATRAGILTLPASFSGAGPTTTDLVDLPEGEHVLTFHVSSPFSLVTPIVVAGDCLERPIFALSEAGDYTETYLSYGCEIIFEINASADWELTIEPATP
jgi:hypothetical protein